MPARFWHWRERKQGWRAPTTRDKHTKAVLHEFGISRNNPSCPLQIEDMELQQSRNLWNRVRFVAGDKRGHYESYFFRANHPSKPHAFWIRYTIFSPTGDPASAIGELWSIYFDGESNRISAGKSEFPISQCSFSDRQLDVRIAEATAINGHIKGHTAQPNQVAWDLRIAPNDNPVLLFLPAEKYESRFPKAKALVSSPLAVYNGEISVNGESFAVDNWLGSENHNWGAKHTDEYCWGQVAGFEQAEGTEGDRAFIEAATARLKIGPLWTPPLSFAVLRLGNEEYRFNTIAQALKADGSYSWTEWSVSTSNGSDFLTMKLTANGEHFVGLTYYNPPGGTHTILNTKIATCEVTLTKSNGDKVRLKTANRAAFEICTDRADHAVPVVA